MLLSAKLRPSSGGSKTWLAFRVPSSDLFTPVSGRTGLPNLPVRSLAAQPPSMLYMKQKRPVVALLRKLQQDHHHTLFRTA